MKNLFNAAALIGASIGLIACVSYFNGLLQWGLRNHWHFMYVGGFGSRFLYHFELMIASLFVWSLSRLSRYDVRQAFDIAFYAALFMFVLAAIIETLVSKFYP